MASLVSYDSDSLLPEAVVNLENDSDQQPSQKVPRIEDQPLRSDFKDEVNSALNFYSSESDTGDVKEPTLATFKG